MIRDFPVFLLFTICLMCFAPQSYAAEPAFGLCLSGTKYSHAPISGKCSVAYGEGNFEVASSDFNQLAKKGLAAAQYNLGQMASRGQGAKKDWGAAKKWYKLAADQGFSYAQINLGATYHSGLGGEKDMGKAVMLYWKAAKQNNPFGQVALGRMYLSGEGLQKKDYAKAKRLFNDAAKQGSALGQYWVGVQYEMGKGVKKNTETALKWYKLAAKQDFRSAKIKIRKIQRALSQKQVKTAQSSGSSCPTGMNVYKKYHLNAVKCLGVFAGFNEAMGKKAEAGNFRSQKSLNAARSVDKQCKYRKTPNVSARDELKFAATNTKMMMINKDMKNLQLTLDTCKKVVRYTYAR
jgi:TPR repeat protein